jgi:formylmethanofuran dehydrogenase subunit E-like metal-binding protein
LIIGGNLTKQEKVNITLEAIKNKKNFYMTQIAINQQIEAIKKVTREAMKTKESALKFLVDAGIVKEKKDAPQPIAGNNKK